MNENHFVFADLSTYDIRVAKAFYENVFGWQYVQDRREGWVAKMIGGIMGITAADENPYLLAKWQGKEISGLYETPQKFKEIGMPSFWMSYIQVSDLEESIGKAIELGGIVEVVETDNPVGKIALIRDPLGAGFTLYEGGALNSRTQYQENSLVWNELFISNIHEVKSFYEGIFNWKIEEGPDRRYDILDRKGEKISAIQEVSNELKGKYEYWAVYFGVKHVEAIKEKVLVSEGSLLYETPKFTVLADPFGAFFHVVPIG
ncbi:MAG: VOC family protein [Bacteroidota bacterium]